MSRGSRVPADFAVCPHCWHVNGPMTRICIRCRADMTLLLQESGGSRWTAAAQSPMPVRGAARLSRSQRALLLGLLVLFALGQLAYAFTPRRSTVAPPGAPASGGR